MSMKIMVATLAVDFALRWLYKWSVNEVSAVVKIFVPEVVDCWESTAAAL